MGFKNNFNIEITEIRHLDIAIEAETEKEGPDTDSWKFPVRQIEGTGFLLRPSPEPVLEADGTPFGGTFPS